MSNDNGNGNETPSETVRAAGELVKVLANSHEQILLTGFLMEDSEPITVFAIRGAFAPKFHQSLQGEIERIFGGQHIFNRFKHDSDDNYTPI